MAKKQGWGFSLSLEPWHDKVYGDEERNAEWPSDTHLFDNLAAVPGCSRYAIAGETQKAQAFSSQERWKCFAFVRVCGGILWRGGGAGYTARGLVTQGHTGVTGIGLSG